MFRSRTRTPLLVAALVAALAVSTTPAAPASVVTVARHPASTVRDANPEFEVCLYNSFDWCLGAHFDASGAVLVALDELGRAGTVIVVIEWLAKRSAQVAKIVKILGSISGGDLKATASSIVGECLGAWGPGQNVHPGSCASAHGIYWQFSGGGKVWNTYAKGDMVTGSPAQNEHVWVLHTPKSGDFVKWDDTCYSGCQPVG